jgi:hypothetical protein
MDTFRKMSKCVCTSGAHPEVFTWGGGGGGCYPEAKKNLCFILKFNLKKKFFN